jgi:alginate O-acetyltransferase complex protein AlgI
VLFNSFTFLLCFPIAAAVYAFLRSQYRSAVSQAWLLVLSLAFYVYAKPGDVPFLLGSILFNWAISQRIAATDGSGDETRDVRKRWLIVGLCANILFLSCFKYVNFFFGAMAPNWGFPLGISFFTLTQVMYLVDCYEELIPANNLFDHATFVSFFPYVIAGPLTRARAIVPQLRGESGAPSWENVARGFALFCIGLFKKVVFADALSQLADAGFNAPGEISSLEAWACVLAYTFQIYFDFSGYTDMARGIGRMLGFELPLNFNIPYISKSVIEFWQRWHMSLSGFITTYLYTPILRGFKGRATLAKSAVATIIAMSISGLWHGPAWTFVVWGLCHGVALATNQYWRKKIKIALPAGVGWLLTFSFVTLAEVFFRAANLPVAFQMFARLYPAHGLHNELGLRHLIVFTESFTCVVPSLLCVPFVFFGPSSQDFVERLKPALRYSLAYACLLTVALVFLNSVVAKEFIYFGF